MVLDAIGQKSTLVGEVSGFRGLKCTGMAIGMAKGVVF